MGTNTPNPSARRRKPGDTLSPETCQLIEELVRTWAAQSAAQPYDMPASQDDALIDLLDTAHHHAVKANALHELRLRYVGVGSCHEDGTPMTNEHGQWTDRTRTEHEAQFEEAQKHEARITSAVRRARHLRATTPAAIFAKAALIRASKTAATVLAMSLADDLLSSPALRRALWPAKVD